MTRRIRIAPKTTHWFLLALLLSSCSLLNEGDELEDLRANQRLWQQHHAADYQFDLTKGCFCGPGLYPARIVVRADTVNAVLDPATGAPLTPPESEEPALELYPDEYATIDGLFGVIERAIEQKAYQLDVTYDPERGYPRNIRIEYSKHATDDEFFFEVLRYEAVEF